MVEIKGDTLVIGVETPREEIPGIKALLQEQEQVIKRVVLEGDIERLGSTMTLQLLMALSKSRPELIVQGIPSDGMETSRWGNWSLL